MMSDGAKRVSVVIPVFNGERTIARAIDSALAQRYDGEIEIVVVNDGSTDGTAAVLERFASRVRVLSQPNRGTPCSRNSGTRMSTGEFIAFLDADDVWLPDKLAKSIDALTSNPDCVLAYSEVFHFTPDGDRIEMPPPASEARHSPSMSDMLSRVWPILPSATVLRRQAFEQSGGACEQFTGYSWGEDTYFFTLVRECGAFVFLDEPLVGKESVARIDRVDRAVAGYQLFKQLVRRRYGFSARGLLRDISRGQVNLLTSLGLAAMRRGSTREARLAYLRGLRYQPLEFRLFARLLWAALPAGARHGLSLILPKPLGSSLG
jgi:glycosyltransferase involved in cell wall biosynthesis